MKGKPRVYAVLVEPHRVRPLVGPNSDDIACQLQAAIKSISGMPYPAQYGRSGLLLLGDDTGLFKPLPYNRWGVVGTFAVVARSNRPLSDKKAKEIMSDVEDRDGGYLDDASKVLNAFREPFRVYGVPPAGATPCGKAWFEG